MDPSTRTNNHELDDYDALVGLLVRISQAALGVSGDDDAPADADSFLTKFIAHMITARQLYLGLPVPDMNAALYDVASLNVVARAALETMLMFYWVFPTEVEPEVASLRYLMWRYAGDFKASTGRQDYTIAKRDLDEAARRADETWQRIQGNPAFTETLSRDERKQLFRVGKLPRPKWKCLGDMVGLHRRYSEDYYGRLSEFAHSGSYSLLQLWSVTAAEQQRERMKMPLSLIQITSAFVARQYCRTVLVPYGVNVQFSWDEVLQVHFWIDIGGSDPLDPRWAKLYEEMRVQSEA